MRQLVAVFFVAVISFFSIKPVFAQSCSISGDANFDCKVDGIDYVIWLTNYGKTVNNGSSSGDFNGNTIVDGIDYVIWLTNYGKTALNPTPTVSAANNITVNFTVSNEDFKNPERGFMKESEVFVDQPLNASQISAVNAADSVVWVYFRLDNYRDPRDAVGVTVTNYQGKLLEPLGSGKGLDTVNAAFAVARSKGLKLMIRFIYNWGPDWSYDPMKVTPDAPLDLVLQHIAQLKPILSQNSDVLAFLEAGFVGHWGEWHSTKYLNDLSSRKAIVDALLNAIPKDRMILLRYPRYKELFYGGPLNASLAFNETDQARVGHHNDCFLEGDDDGSTYSSTTEQLPVQHSTYCDGQSTIPCWKNYVSQESNFVPNMGESCAANLPRSECTSAVFELSQLHFSLLNNGFDTDVLNSWVSGGCMGTIRQRLGYRLELVQVTLPSSAKAGANIYLNIKMKNSGFAPVYNKRTGYLVLSGPARYEIPLPDFELRRLTSGTESVFNLTALIPINAQAGNYKAGLWFPDNASTLKNNPAYDIRFANANIWDQTSGINYLLQNFTILP